jgi:hypothetical protein
MSDITFIAEVPDPSVSTTVYGKGHKTSAITDESQIMVWRNQGKAMLLGAPPRAAGPTAIAATTATISYTVDGATTSNGIDWGTTTAYGSSGTGSPAGGGGVCTVSLSSLTTKTTYHYRVKTVNANGTVYTPDLTFTTA